MAMKVVSRDILHKSDAGGVKLKVAGEPALRESFDAILANAKTYKTDARIDGVLVSPMAAPGVEVIIGTLFTKVVNCNQRHVEIGSDPLKTNTNRNVL